MELTDGHRAMRRRPEHEFVDAATETVG